METKRWGLSKGARRSGELLWGVETLGFLERNTTTTSRNRSRETHIERSMSGMGSYPVEKEKKANKRRKRNGSRLNNKSAQLCLTLTPSNQPHDQHTQQLYTHTHAREKKKRGFLRYRYRRDGLQLEKQSTQVAKQKKCLTPLFKINNLYTTHTDTHTDRKRKLNQTKEHEKTFRLFSICFLTSRVFFHSQTLSNYRERANARLKVQMTLISGSP